ncbi:MAG: division/cell wall cluster transcriptional repressor MraZ [Thermoguttaceae bacterium]|jgi:MraZ protein
MPAVEDFLLGEHPRTLDERWRVSIPSEFADLLSAESTDCILAKERPGCLSLWSAPLWQARLDEGMELVKQKMRAGRLQEKIAQVQLLGRLLSTRHRTVQLAGRGRLLIPEGFREFLGVEPNGEALILGAAVCIEIWQPAAWIKYLETKMPKFRRLFDQLSK